MGFLFCSGVHGAVTLPHVDQTGGLTRGTATWVLYTVLSKAAARAAMASGLAIGGAPFLLARLSDTVSLRTAYLIVPALLIALAVRSLAARG